MTDRTARKFQKLRDAHEEAVRWRKAASKASRAIRGLDGKTYSLTVLASKAGARALVAEIHALRDERRALKRLAAFTSRIQETRAASGAATPEEIASPLTKKTARKRKKSSLT